jgi:ribonuclease-3
LQLNKHEQLMQALGYAFRDENLLRQALTHRSYGGQHNERLEFLGDSLLNFIIGEQLYQQFPQIDEGDLTHMRAELVKGDTLGEVAAQFDLGNHLILGSGENSSGGRLRASLQGDAVEALIAAIYLDAGLTVCRQRVLEWWQVRLQATKPGSHQKDSKTQLQELLQSLKKTLPEYRMLEARGADHCKEFEIACVLEKNSQVFKGVGKTRRHAEQQAAQAALVYLQTQIKTKHSSSNSSAQLNPSTQAKHD